MSDISVAFDRLPTQFPFLAWPRVTAYQAKHPFLRPGDDVDALVTDFNFCQVFRTFILDREHPMRFLLEHLETIEYSLRYGVRHSVHPVGAAEMITLTGGLQWWMEHGVAEPEPRLAVFRGRGLMYRPEVIGDGLGPGSWLSDVGLLPL